MKFRDDKEKASFLIECGRPDLVDNPSSTDDELVEDFIKQRKKTVDQWKNFRRSQQSKQAWRQNRWKNMKSIHRYHRSTKGRRQHRKMGRFIATRIFRPSLNKASRGKDHIRSDNEKMEALSAVNSVMTHLFVEQEHYQPLSDHIDFSEMLDHVIPQLQQISRELFEERWKDIDADDVELLCRLTDDRVLSVAALEALGMLTENGWNDGTNEQMVSMLISEFNDSNHHYDLYHYVDKLCELGQVDKGTVFPNFHGDS